MVAPSFRKIVYLCLLLLTSLFVNAQTKLIPGDVAIVGVNTDNPDSFSFVLLKDIEADTKIFFTDSGVTSEGDFRGNEGAVLFTAPSALSFGTIIKFTGISGDFTNASNSTVGNAGFNLSTSGDQIIVFGGAIEAPTYIFAIQTNSNQFQTGSNDSNQSDLPVGLTVGLNALAVGKGSGAENEFDNSVYNLSVTSGDKVTLLKAIANNENWNGSNSRIVNLPSNGDITGSNSSNTIIVKGNNIPISNQDTTPSTYDNTDFGISEINSMDTSKFSIINKTGGSVKVSNINILGADASKFSLSTTIPNFPFEIAEGDSKEFIIEYMSNAVGSKVVTIQIVNDFNNFSFNVSATSIDSSSITLIHDVQGSGEVSPLNEQVVTVKGIVVGDFQDIIGGDGNLSGFFLQEEDVDADANLSTSEGLFVFDGAKPLVDVAVGDKVSVTGKVVEFFGVTELTNVANVTVESRENMLPTAFNISLPVSDIVVNSDLDFIPDFENVEGMRVKFPQELTISEMFNLDRFGEIRVTQGGRMEQFTQNNVPSSSGFSSHLKNVAKRSVMLDDGLSIQNPNPIRFPDGNLSTSDAFRMGNTIKNLTGVVHFSRGSGGSGTETYRIHPTATPSFTGENIREAVPKDVGGRLKVVSFNVLNCFKTIDVPEAVTAIGGDPRGADTVEEFNRQRMKLINAIIAIDADILGVVELENDFMPNSSGNAIEDLVTGLNTRLGATIYDWVNPDNQFVGDDVIATGILYKPLQVELKAGTSTEILTDANLLELGLPKSPAVFNGDSTNRSPIAATFKEISTDEVFTVVVTHFKSKGSPGTAGTLDVDKNDGAGNGNQTRLNGVTALNAWINTDPTGSNDVDFVLLGDFNAYGMEAPITFLRKEGYVDVARLFMGDNAYSYVFDGQVGTLDYAFVSSSLLPSLTNATEWHVNADEADAIDYNLDFNRNSEIFDGSVPYRNSDHDPVIFGLNLKETILGNERFLASEKQINIFPVPVKNTLNIIYNEFQGEIKLSIFNIYGVLISSRIVHANANLKGKINTSQLASGTYYLVLEAKNKKVKQLFTKQ